MNPVSNVPNSQCSIEICYNVGVLFWRYVRLRLLVVGICLLMKGRFTQGIKYYDIEPHQCSRSEPDFRLEIVADDNVKTGVAHEVIGYQE